MLPVGSSSSYLIMEAFELGRKLYKSFEETIIKLIRYIGKVS